MIQALRGEKKEKENKIKAPIERAKLRRKKKKDIPWRRSCRDAKSRIAEGLWGGVFVFDKKVLDLYLSVPPNNV
jgi:hypothetical protein